MLKNKSYTKKTKQGKVLKVVREHYLRDDIWSGSPLDPYCDESAHKLSDSAKHYLVIDTNVALQQIDVLEHCAVDDVIVLGVVLEEVRHRNSSVYARLRALTANPARRFYVFSNEHHKDTYIKQLPGESPNDRNDRAIRVAASWYTRQVPQVPILLLTDDADNRRKAQAEHGLTAISTASYARSRTDCPELADLVAAAKAEEVAGEGGRGAMDVDSGGPSKRQRLYEEHKPMSDVLAGIKAGKYHQGTLRVNRFNAWEGYIGSESVGADILISGRRNMNRALDGDVVVVELLPEDQWKGPSAHLPTKAEGSGEVVAEEGEARQQDDEDDGGHIAQVAPGEHYGEDAAAAAAATTVVQPCGQVVGIIRRNWRTRGYCGSLQPPRPGQRYGQHVLFCPVERKFPFVRLHTRQAETLSDKRIVAVIDGWELDSAYPHGHYVRTLGTIGDRDTETDVLLIEHDVNSSPFSDAVHGCVPPLPWAVTEADLADPKRMDLRDRVICSVDPPGCRDIDDALHCRRLPNGNYELGVHIADVTHFLRPGTAMDDEAARRATTVYLVNRRIDMLPKPLTEDICSLRGGVERLAFSVMWEVTEDVQFVGASFTKSVIRSSVAMTYAEAQSRIDDPRLTDDISVSLRAMNRIAKVLRQRRSDRGALQLASPEVKFEIDRETHDPTDVGMYQIREANQMVEEMMLLANCTVAERTLRAYAACALLRRHPTPAPRQFDPLLKAAAAVGVEIDPSTSKSLAASLDNAVRPDDAYFNKLVRIMATRCMTQAVYFGSGELSEPEYHHYGLAAPLYTHFTSPIRRYADVMVHRLLSASLDLDPLPESSRDSESLRSLCSNLNDRHHNAQLAGRASVELHTTIFFKDRTVVADARVTKVRANGLILFVPKYGIEGPVHFNPKAGDGASVAEGASQQQWQLDDAAQTVASADGQQQYKIFDKAAVRISVVEGMGHRRQLRLELVDRQMLPQEEMAVA